MVWLWEHSSSIYMYPRPSIRSHTNNFYLNSLESGVAIAPYNSSKTTSLEGNRDSASVRNIKRSSNSLVIFNIFVMELPMVSDSLTMYNSRLGCKPFCKELLTNLTLWRHLAIDDYTATIQFIILNQAGDELQNCSWWTSKSALRLTETFRHYPQAPQLLTNVWSTQWCYV